jgi:hypothetical protein
MHCTPISGNILVWPMNLQHAINIISVINYHSKKITLDLRGRLRFPHQFIMKKSIPPYSLDNMFHVLEEESNLFSN